MRTKQIVVASMAVVMMFVAIGCSSSKSSKDTGSAAATTTTKGGDSGADQGSDQAKELPAGWPSELAMPSGTTVVEATKIGDGGSRMVIVRNDSEPQGIFDAFKAELSQGGYEIVGSTFTPSDKGGYGSISAKGPKYTVAIAFGPNDTGTTSQAIINVAPVEP